MAGKKVKMEKVKMGEEFGRDSSIFALNADPEASAHSVQEGPATASEKPERKPVEPACEIKVAATTEIAVGVGDLAPDFELECGKGMLHKLSSYRGRKVILSFFRFAACPICMHNIAMMQKQYEMLHKANIVIISVFRSTPKNVATFTAGMLGSTRGPQSRRDST